MGIVQDMHTSQLFLASAAAGMAQQKHLDDTGPYSRCYTRGEDRFRHSIFKCLTLDCSVPSFVFAGSMVAQQQHLVDTAFRSRRFTLGVDRFRRYIFKCFTSSCSILSFVFAGGCHRRLLHDAGLSLPLCP